jgi:hypothetical protein
MHASGGGRATPRLPGDGCTAEFVGPDFVIVGAAKCGTTALYTYLASHPSIAMSSRKEPFYWCPDIESFAKIRSPGQYATLWDGATPGSMKGEATPAYIRSAVAIPAILTANPAAMFILLLRNPIEMAAAFHAQMLYSGQEDVRDFEAAWRLQRRRGDGKDIPLRCEDPARLQYERICSLGDQLERFISVVPEGQRLILLYDDFAADPRGIYLRALAFLNLPDDGRRLFEPVNSNKSLRWPALSAIYRRWATRLSRAYRPFRRAAGWVGLNAHELVVRLTEISVPRPPLDPEFRSELARVFRPQINKIESLLQRGLPHWTDGPEAS